VFALAVIALVRRVGGAFPAIPGGLPGAATFVRARGAAARFVYGWLGAAGRIRFEAPIFAPTSSGSSAPSMCIRRARVEGDS